MKTLIAALLSMISFVASAATFVPVLVYHRVTTAFPEGITVVSPTQFDNHLRRIKELGYTTLTISQLEDYIKNGQVPEKSIVITFDDGRKDNLDAAEILRRHQMKATFYMLSGFEENYLTRDEVRKIAENFEIGAHSHTHFMEWADKLDTLDERVMYGEAVMSKVILEDVIGKPVTSFAWPFGYFRSQMLPSMRKLGFTSTVHVNSETLGNHKDADLMFIQRLNIDGNCNADHVETMITTGKLKACK